MAIKPEEKYQRTTKDQEFQYKLGKFTILTALIVEIINVIPGTIFGNLWLCPWAYVDEFFFVLSRILPTTGLILAICVFKGLRFVRYGLAAIYAINIFRLTLTLETVLEIITVIYAAQVFNWLNILFIISTFVALIYNVIMFISMAISKNISTYSYCKLYK